ncbi:hypothetical protein CNR22_08295 [Sphingobacteriaceae bacterium]|nr:hypothetical protein CNR22_08295 [Sphingobacteriaceae bacterium]
MLKNLISSFFAKSTVAFTLLGILLVQTQQLGSEEVGQVSKLILNLAIIQTISEIYTGSALVYFIPKHAISKIYSYGVLWTIACIFGINSVFYTLQKLYPQFDLGVKDLWLHVLILSFLVTMQAFHTVVLLAKEKIKIYNFLIFFQPLLLLAVLCVAVFILQIKNVNAYLIAAYVSWTVSFLISTFFILKMVTKDEGKSPVKIKDVLRNGFVNQLGNLAHTLSNRYNYYMIGTTMLVGIYSSATSLIESVWILSGSISPIILTHIANQKDVSNNSRVTFLLSKICFLLSLLCVLVVVVLPEDFFTFLLGKDFSGTKTIMLYLSPGVLCLSFSSIISHYFSGLGKQRILLLANSSGLAITLCTSYYFISRFGLVGACYAASLSYIAQAIVLTLVFMKNNNYTFLQLFAFRKDLELLRR